MSRLDDVIRNQQGQFEWLSKDKRPLIANLQDLNITLAMLYDLEVEAAKRNQEIPEWLPRWLADFEEKHGMR